MKLRIQGDSLRLRLTQKEVASLNRDGAVECAIHFPGGRALRYSVISGNETNLNYTDSLIRMTLPQKNVRQWAESDQVSIEGFAGNTHLLVEKDFQCLHQERRDPDAFPNPTERNQ